MAKVQLVSAARDQQSTTANLLELYAHDFSEFHRLDLGADGRFGYRNLSLYWSEADHFPFLIKVDGRLAGLALVKKGSEVSDKTQVWDMAEFFVVRGHRRHGIGTKIAHELWRTFPGPWEVRVRESNRTAVDFWECAISEFGGETISPARIEKDGDYWYLFAFECKAAL